MPENILPVSPVGPIESRIVVVRGERAILDADIAALYGASTRALVQAVKRNPTRFPPDFMFSLDEAECLDLRSQIVISSRVSGPSRPRGWGGRRHLPCAFTEQGVAMLSGVLRSPRAVRVNVEIVRAFVRLRRAAMLHQDLARRIDELEQRHDARFKVVFDALRALVEPPPDPPGRRIGFHAEIPAPVRFLPATSRRVSG